MRPQSIQPVERVGRTLALSLITMRKSSYISKRLTDSVLGFALIATPLSFLSRPLGGTMLPSAPQTSSLGQFLESEVSTRIERVSGRHFSNSVRRQQSRDIASAVAEASYLYEVDPFLLLSMIEVESRYHTDAVGLHGEIGLMQIKPSTARWVAPSSDPLYDCDLHQVRCNVMMGARYVGHLQRKVERQRSGKDEMMAQNLASAPQFREHVLRSYNLGPAKANRLAVDRTPAADELTPYATKIAWRTDRMLRRYLASALGETPAVSPEASADLAKSNPRENRHKLSPESISTVALIH